VTIKVCMDHIVSWNLADSKAGKALDKGNWFHPLGEPPDPQKRPMGVTIGGWSSIAVGILFVIGAIGSVQGTTHLNVPSQKRSC
jgi:hypothetical protein